VRRIVDVAPVPKPRMTRADKWKKRDCVLRYRAFKDKLRLRRVTMPERCWVRFVLPMPEGWSEKKRFAYDNQPHRQRPDLDNLLKGLMDAVLKEDSGVHDVQANKVWGKEGRIEISEVPWPDTCADCWATDTVVHRCASCSGKKR
jgi:Holliday junction resolvase RusA-like endonuclease